MNSNEYVEMFEILHIYFPYVALNCTAKFIIFNFIIGEAFLLIMSIRVHWAEMSAVLPHLLLAVSTPSKKFIGPPNIVLSSKWIRENGKSQFIWPQFLYFVWEWEKSGLTNHGYVHNFNEKLASVKCRRFYGTVAVVIN